MDLLELEGELIFEEAETGSFVKMKLVDGRVEYLDELIKEAFGPGPEFGSVLLVVERIDT